MRQIKQIIDIKFVLTSISLIIIDMSKFINHDGHCIEYGTFIMGEFFHYKFLLQYGSVLKLHTHTSR